MEKQIDLKVELEKSEEYEKQKKDKKICKLESGEHTLTILANPEPHIYKDSEGKEVPQIRLGVQREHSEFIEDWYIPRSYGASSVWVQLCEYIKSKGLSWVGKTVRVQVIGKDKDKRYFIL